ncbi:MAG: tetratricopeptide repeat protein [Gemmatimonadota bacterium]|nr:MAG: tetratricopeptide repeat protein [Gemmatimonadota bacterium]
MPFTFNPESKLQERLGQIAVATLLGVVFLGLSGCDIPINDDKEAEPVNERPAVAAAAWVAPTVEEPVAVEETVIPKFDPATVTFEEAGVAYDERRYSDAVDMFAAYAERHPDNAWSHYMLGLSALKAGQFDRSESALRRSLELDPNHLKSMLNLSRVLLNTGRPEQALPYLDVVVDIDPVSDDGYRLRGLAYYDLARDEDAIDSFREAITINPHDAWSMNNLALVLIRAERFEEALPALARATELRDDVDVFQNNLGIALERTGYLEAAAEAYRAALVLDEGYDKALVSLARVEKLEQNPAMIPVDLKVLARRFVTEMEGWYPPIAHVPPLDEGTGEVDEPETPEIELPEFPGLQEIGEGGEDSTKIEIQPKAKQDTAKVKPDSTKLQGSIRSGVKAKPIKP